MRPLHTLLGRRFLLVLAFLLISGGLLLTNSLASRAFRAPLKSLLGGNAEVAVVAAQDQPVEKLSATVQAQIAALQEEKRNRTVAQRKLDSQLLYAIKMDRKVAIAQGVQTLQVNVPVDGKGRIKVDITATLGGDLIEKITEAGGEVEYALADYHAIRATIPAQRIEEIAASGDVKFIRPALDGVTNAIEKVEAPSAKSPAPGFEARAARVRDFLSATLNQQKPQQNKAPVNIKNSPTVGAQSSEGDTTHRAVNARNTFGVSGAGIKIGVLSDGVGGLSLSQASGDLGQVTVLPGQAGASGAEGTAMLEIIHDLVPNAQLFFATAFNGGPSFANNIRALRAAGCDIIVDDVFYYDESPFQEGQAPNIVGDSDGAMIAQAVIDVTNAGALYFSSAGNSGSKVNNTSGVWEGDFVDGGAATGALAGAGNVHNFGGSLFNSLTAVGNAVYLFWTDPLGASDNDYDLYILNSAGTSITGGSTNAQDGTQDPVEGTTATLTANSRIVVVKFAGADRYLHLNTNRGRLSINTNGQTKGHSAVPAAFSVAATPANVAFGAAPNPVGPYPSPFSATNKCELFSSDGPRKVFFNNQGEPYTPGNVSATGGAVRQKPDITAADGVQVTGVGGFGYPFFGTSAAAPHAAAIAALIKQASPGLTPTQIRNVLTSTAIDIEAAGYDTLAGSGIIDALVAVQSVSPVAQASLTVGTVTAVEGSFGNGNSALEPGELGNVTVQLNNNSAVAATNVQATVSLLSATSGVTVISGGPVSYGTIAAGGNATNATPFVISLTPAVPCGVPINLALTVTLGGGASPVTYNFSVTPGKRQSLITSTLDTTAPTAGTGYTATTGTQTGRLARSGIPSDCAAAKTAPGLTATTGARRYDAYTFTNTTANAQCVTVTVAAACGANVYSAAYNNSGFVPSNPNTNFLADAGASNVPMIYSFTVAAGQQFTVVVHEVNVGGAPSCSYTLDVGLYGCDPQVPQAALALGTVTATEGSFNNNNGVVDPGEVGNLAVQLTNPSTTTAATNVQATLALTTPVPGVTILNGTASYGTIPASGSATNASPFVIALTPAVICGTPINFTETVTFGGGLSPVSFNFSLTPGLRQAPITTVLDATAPPTGTGYTAITGTQTGRANRFSPAADCFNVKDNPGLAATTGARRFDAYTFTNTASTAQCVTVTTTSTTGTSLYTVAYGSGGFIPATPDVNFVADPGSSSTNQNFSFNVAAGQPFTVVVHDVNTTASNSTYTLNVGLYSCAAQATCPTITVNPTSIPSAKTGTAYSQTFTASGGVAPLTLALTGTLPAGVSFNPATGLLSGTPTQAGNFPFTVTATDPVGCSGSRSYTLAVNTLSLGLTDPALCTGAGNTLSVTAAVTNSSNTAQNISFTATPQPGLVAVAGTCTSSVPAVTCQVVSGTNVTASGSLTAGQSVTFNYLVQVADNVQAGTQLCVNSIASIAGAAPVTFQACTTANCPAAGPGAPLAGSGIVNDQKAGSVLVYNTYTSSAANPSQQNTRLSLTNTHPTLTAYVHLFFVDGTSCSIADSFICLTANQTASFTAADVDPGTSGYLVAVATSSAGCPINFNYLIGDEFVKFSSGHAANLGAEAIGAIAGGIPACGINSSTAQLNFDGVSYGVLPRTLAADNIPSRADGNDTLLILNNIGGSLSTGAGTLGTITGILYDDSEAGVSFSFSGSCQLRSSLSNSFPRTTPRFETFIPAGRSGWARFYAPASNAVLGAIINLNPNSASAAGAFNRGHNLHVLTTTASVNVVIPVFPPSC